MERLRFEAMLTRFREQGLLKAKGRRRPDSPHVLAAIQTRKRLEGLGETLRQALHILDPREAGDGMETESSTKRKILPMPGTDWSRDKVWASCCLAVRTMVNATSLSHWS